MGGPPARKHFVGLLDRMGVEYWNFHTVESVERDADRRFPDLSASCRVDFVVSGGEKERRKSVRVDSFFCTMPQRAADWVLNIEGMKRNKPHPKAGAVAYGMGQS